MPVLIRKKQRPLQLDICVITGLIISRQITLVKRKDTTLYQTEFASVLYNWWNNILVRAWILHVFSGIPTRHLFKVPYHTKEKLIVTLRQENAANTNIFLTEHAKINVSHCY